MSGSSPSRTVTADLAAALLDIPQGTQPKPGLSSVAGWNRYDTDDEYVLHLWAHPMDGPSTSWDIRLPKVAALPVSPTDGLDAATFRVFGLTVAEVRVAIATADAYYPQWRAREVPRLPSGGHP